MSTASGLPIPVASTTLKSGSDALRKELGFLDLVFASVLLVVIPDFFGTAVKAGPSHVFLWLLAIVFFFVPQAFVVSHLNRRFPIEGGLFEWARSAFGDLAGFLVALNLWTYVVINAASIGLVTTNYLAYMLGPNAGWISTNRGALFVITFLLVALLMLLTRVGLRFGKWVTNAGSFLTVLTILILAALPFFHRATGQLASYQPLRMVVPAFSLFTLSVFSKMTFGALSGLEFAAIFSGESRNPARHFPRAILLAVPLIAFLYILGTSAILAFVSPDSVDLIGPIPQALHAGFAGVAGAQFIIPAAILLILMNYLATFSVNFAANTRLPMVAGWDHLLPAWFTQLHPKYRTPVNSVLFLGAVTLLASLIVLIGVHEQEAFALLQICSFGFYGIAYVALFAIPLFARKESNLRSGLALQLAAVPGLALTLLFLALSAFPIIDVANPLGYSVKMISALAGVNVLGVLLFRAQRRNSAKKPAA